MTKRCEKLLMISKALLKKVLASLQRFPETLLICAATALVLILLNHGGTGGEIKTGEYLERLAAVLALGIPLSLCIKVFFERASFLKIPLKTVIYIAAAAGLALYYIFLLKDFEMVALSRYVAINLALYLSFTFIPYFYRRQNYELYVIRLFISFLITYLFAAVLFGGLSAILATINYLFSAGIAGKIYLDIWLVVAGIFAPAFFLAGIPRRDEEIRIDSYPKVISILLSYIVMPLILAYCAILYVYFLRILTTQQWPEAMVSHLVLWYAIVSTVVIFCIFPLRPSNRWTKAFIAFFPKLILPLLGLMFVAMSIRVKAYGITENRYFVLAAGLWVTGSMLYLIISKKPRNVFLPASLALVAALTVCGPWSSYSLSVCSQNRRFEKIAAEHNLIREKKIVRPAAALPDSAREEISSIIIYFDRYHGLERLRALPEGFSTDKMEALFGFPLHEWARPGDAETYFYYTLDSGEACWDVSGFDYFMEFSKGEQQYPADDSEVTYSPANHELRIMSEGEVIYTRNMAELAGQLYRVSSSRGRELIPKDEMTFADQKGDLKLLYIFSHFSGHENHVTTAVNIDYMEFYLFLSRGP